ncbi:NAD(P)/FAD-dependent oxidoreductase [Sphingomonas sp.]|uniref:NAD(P)/FAD-dependent oxidoreductase n=1 Tax=Sphingomonas sp. TaxID=28214 RepID=UPI002DD6AAED|nr:FAD-dependent monooxygenase [Sphingomonas sp.]
MPPLILGGGPAGSAAAIALAEMGIAATILERTREPGDALCGGFLSWRTLAALERLGLPADMLNPRATLRLRLFAGDHVAEAALPGPARAVSRRRLDALLLARAGEVGASVERGVAVRTLDGGTARLADGGEVTGDTILLATGKHELRGAARDARDTNDPMIGLRARLKPTPAIGDAIELHLFDRGYAGLVVQEDGRANLCLAVARSRLQMAGDPPALLAALARENPALATRLDGLEPGAGIDAIANVPYGWRATSTVPALYRLGDQAAVIPSLAGEGMGIALVSGKMAARAVARGIDARLFQTRLAHHAARPLAIAGAIAAIARRPSGARAIVRLSRAPWLVRAAAHLTRINQSGVDGGA